MQEKAIFFLARAEQPVGMFSPLVPIERLPRLPGFLGEPSCYERDPLSHPDLQRMPLKRPDREQSQDLDG